MDDTCTCATTGAGNQQAVQLLPPWTLNGWAMVTGDPMPWESYEIYAENYINNM